MRARAEGSLGKEAVLSVRAACMLMLERKVFRAGVLRFAASKALGD